MTRLELPLAMPQKSPHEVPSDYYYEIPERPIYKSYTVYDPSREPAGYWTELLQKDPEIFWGKDANGVMHRPQLKTQADWTAAGRLVFSAASTDEDSFGSILDVKTLRDPEYYQDVHVPLTSAGIFPFADYVIKEKGKVVVGQISCGTCHTRILSDGSTVPGAQGNFPFDRTFARTLRKFAIKRQDKQAAIESGTHAVLEGFFSVPWLNPDPAQFVMHAPITQLSKVYDAIPPGVLDRQGSSAVFPPQIPDLIGVRDRIYLDHTGLLRHHGPGDMMRYASLNQDMNVFGDYDGWIPFTDKTHHRPNPKRLGRYSDEQLYALALYIYSLKPPPNPNFYDQSSRRGEKIFKREGCGNCHTPPLYTNNKLTLAPGFAMPSDTHGDAIMALSVGTDPRLATQTRRGTGYYKVPSLKGVWYRGPFEHNGSVASLEDWFDSARLKDDYVPTGFAGYEVTHKAVAGHTFGTNLSTTDKSDLIAFLKTL